MPKNEKSKIKKKSPENVLFTQRHGFSHIKHMVRMALLLIKSLALLSCGKLCINNPMKYQRIFDPGLKFKMLLW